jgi:hypothetical protein
MVRMSPASEVMTLSSGLPSSDNDVKVNDVWRPSLPAKQTQLP